MAAASSSASDVSALAASKVHELSKASTCLSLGGRRELDIGCEAAKDVLQEKFRAQVSAASGSPLLTSKSADGTPMNVVDRQRGPLPSGRTFQSSGRKTLEILSKNQFLRGRSALGQCETSVLLQEAQALTHGKKTRAIVAACLADWRSLRQLGHVGCAVEHYCFDRLGIQALERFFRQWHAENSQHHGHLVTDDVDLGTLRLSEFVVVTACALHDAQNAFRWGMRSHIDDKDMLRDIYVSIESLRNSFDVLRTYMAEWVAARLSFARSRGAEWVDRRRALYHMLGADMDTADVLASDLELVFEDGRLWVCGTRSSLALLIDDITDALQSLWKFVRWSLSRFLTVGTSSRTLVAALITGLSDLVDFIYADGHADLWYLRGFTRLTSQYKAFVVKSAMISRVAEAALQELMEDSRVAIKYESLWATLSEEMLWLVSVDVDTWMDLANIANVPWEELRSECIAGGHISFHFFWRRCLEVAGGMPWALCRGGSRQLTRAEGGRRA